MLAKLFAHLRRQWMGALALLVALTGGTAYAANTVFSSDIVNGEVKTADIGTDEVRSVDVRNDSLTGGGLTGADINEASLDAVQGRGRLLSNRRVFAPAPDPTRLLVVPGLGELEAHCQDTNAQIIWRNSTSSIIDFWRDSPGSTNEGPASPGVAVLVAHTDSFHGATFVLGLGSDPGPKRIATLHAFASQPSDGAPCSFQAQGPLWTSE